MELRIIERNLTYPVYKSEPKTEKVYTVQAKVGFFRKWKNISFSNDFGKVFKVRDNNHYFARYFVAVAELDKIKEKYWRLNKRPSEQISDKSEVMVEYNI